MKPNVFLLWVAISMAGCTVSGGLVPAKGPLVERPIPRPYVIKVSGYLTGGEIKVFLDDSELCVGPWALASRSKDVPAVAYSQDPRSSHMQDDWDFVYGPGFFVAHVLGSRLDARAILTGTKGTTMIIEFINEDNWRGNTKGVAEDNKGNVFKATIYN